MPGPVPKRSEERRRRNKSDVGLVKAAGAESVVVPDAVAEWHPIAAAWFESLKASGQSQFYEPSDWATAVYVADAMSRNATGARFSAQLFAAVMSAMTDLLTTEGARRRARVELERGAVVVDSPAVALMAKYRQAAGD